jgi:hypothetical protein
MAAGDPETGKLEATVTFMTALEVTHCHLHNILLATPSVLSNVGDHTRA